MSSDPSATPSAGRHRRPLVTLGVAVLLGAGVWLLIGQAVQTGSLLGELRRADPWWFALCLLGEAVSYVAYTYLYRAVAAARGGPRPGFFVALRVTVAGFGAFVVATSAANLAVDYWALRRMGQKGEAAVAQVLAINTAQWTLMALGAGVAAIAMLAGVGQAPLALELAWLLALPVCVPGALWLTAGRRRARFTEDRGSPPRRALAAALRGIVMLRDVAGDGHLLTWAGVGGVVFWAAKILTAWAALRAFGVALDPASVTLAFATGYVATCLPLPAGGVGGVDAARTFAMTAVGVALGPALLGTFAARLFSFWLPIVPALLAGRSLRRLRDDLPRVPRGSGHRPQRVRAQAEA